MYIHKSVFHGALFHLGPYNDHCWPGVSMLKGQWSVRNTIKTELLIFLAQNTFLRQIVLSLFRWWFFHVVSNLLLRNCPIWRVGIQFIFWFADIDSFWKGCGVLWLPKYFQGLTWLAIRAWYPFSTWNQKIRQEGKGIIISHTIVHHPCKVYLPTFTIKINQM